MVYIPWGESDSFIPTVGGTCSNADFYKEGPDKKMNYFAAAEGLPNKHKEKEEALAKKPEGTPFDTFGASKEA